MHVEALDASDAWPPLLRPGVLAGFDVYERWEARLLSECLRPVTRGTGTLGLHLASALGWTDMLRQWQSSDGALSARIGRPFLVRGEEWPNFCHSAENDLDREVLAPLLRRVPLAWAPSAWPAGLTDQIQDDVSVSRREAEATLARYVATRLIGSWVAYQGQGLRSVLASLVSAYALAAMALRLNGSGIVTLGRLTASIRASDWLLLHLLEREQWADWCSQWEGAPDSHALTGLVAAATQTLDQLPWA